MGIKATCHCGARFMATPELAGRIVKCPTCGQSFQVPGTAPASSQSATYEVACSSCRRKYQVQSSMAGRPVRCKACGNEFVIPRPPTSMQPPSPAAVTQSDPLADTGSLDNLGDLSSFVSDPLGSSIPMGSAPTQSAPRKAYGTSTAVRRPRAHKGSANKLKVVSIVLSSLVVLAIIGILGAVFLWPTSSGYDTPAAAWDAHQQAVKNKDWQTMYNTLSPDTRERTVAGIAFMAQMMASSDQELASIMTKHGVDSARSTPDMSSPAGLGQIFSQLQQQVETAADSIEDQEAFFVDVMDYLTEMGQEIQAQMNTQQVPIVGEAQELSDVEIDGDTARGMQTIQLMGRTVNVPVEFRRIEGGWFVHQPSVQEMVSQNQANASPFGGLGNLDASESSDSPALSEGLDEPVDTGKTPEGTLRAYYYYGDRGRQSKLANLVTNNLVDQPLEDGAGRSAQTQAARGVVIDHEEVNGDEAILYYRTWFSLSAAQRGGRPAVARLVKENDVWKLDVKETLRLTMQNTKGKTQFGFYDGSEEWWK